MAKENSGATGGIGFFGLLQIAFIVLKLCGVITWSWAAVFIPTFISAGLIVLVIGVIVICGLIGNKLQHLAVRTPQHAQLDLAIKFPVFRSGFDFYIVLDQILGELYKIA